MMELIQKFDDAVLLYIKAHMHGFIMDRAMVIFTYIGNMGLIWIVIVILLLLNKKYRKIGVMVAGALILSSVFGDLIIKHLVRRLRPFEHIPAMNLLIPKPLSYSFPSGHTTSSFAAAGILSKYLKKYAFGFFVLAALIAFSRLYLYVHYPTDVFAGVILGLLCSRIVIYINNRTKYYL